jgi:hypothetical protein
MTGIWGVRSQRRSVLSKVFVGACYQVPFKFEARMRERQEVISARLRRRWRQPEPSGALIAAAALMASAIGLHALLLPAQLVLPTLSGVFIIAALGLAGFAWLRPVRRTAPTQITCWDVSGALYFIGCGAAMLGEAEYIVPLMEEIKLKR